MSKYAQLASNIGLDIGTIVHKPSPNGMQSYVVLAIDRAQNTIGTIYNGAWLRAVDNQDEERKQAWRLWAEDNLETVTAYYIKHIPKPRKKQGPNYEIAVPPPKPAQPIRTPDMYEFD